VHVLCVCTVFASFDIVHRNALIISSSSAVIRPTIVVTFSKYSRMFVVLAALVDNEDIKAGNLASYRCVPPALQYLALMVFL